MTSRGRALAAGWGAAAIAWVAGCGGGLPLLHPARALRPGEVRAAAGFSGTIATGAMSASLRGATSEASAGAGAVPAGASFAKGALVEAAVSPGLAPFAGARAGLGGQAEVGLAYTGRAVRADVRRAFELSDTWSLSVGAGGSAAVYERASGGELPGIDLGGLHGWGADVPVLVGYASAGDLYSFWFGPRAGWERVGASLTSDPAGGPPAAQPVPLSATRLWGGCVAGGSVGFRHVHVAIEIDLSYASVTGELGGEQARVAGITLAPASALWWTF